MASVTASAALYAYISGTWTQLDVEQGLSASWGSSGNGPLDLLADPGEMKFKLDNSGGLYTPGGPNALAGWKKGVPVKRVVTFENEEYVRFRGYVDSIDIRPSNTNKTATVTCLDWLDYAARHPVVNPGILSSVNARTVMETMLAELEVQPLQTDLDAGVYAFQSALDAIGTNTTAYSEFARVVLNEITHAYLRKDRTHGETLVLENYNTRHGWVTPGEIPLANADSGYALNEDGDNELNEDGGLVILNETAEVTFSSSVLRNFTAPYGDRVINRVKCTARPRRTSASPEILFQLDDPIEIGQKPVDDVPATDSSYRARSQYVQNVGKALNYVLEGKFVDPQGGAFINAIDVIDPVITTDYLMNSAEDGSGADISSSLSVRFVKGTEGFTAILANTNALYPVGYVTQFNVRGTGVFEYNQIEYTVFDVDSIIEHEAQSIQFDQAYRRNFRISFPYARGVVLQHRQPRVILDSVTFCANKSATLMMSYLHTDIGDLRSIDIDELGVSGNYYIQGIEDTYKDGLIWVKWIVKEHPSVQGGDLDFPAIDFTSANGDAVNYDRIIRVSGATERTFAAWVNADLLDGTRTIIAPFADSGGVLMFLSDVSGSGCLHMYSNRYNGSQAEWRSSTTAITDSAWFHVAVCYDHTSLTNDPLMYINGVAQTVVEIDAPLGTLNSEIGTHVVVGNVKTVTQDYTYGFDGQIYDARIYSRFITAAEALELYNGGTPDPYKATDGLVFQAFAEMPADYAAHLNTALDSSDYLFENAYRSTGRVHGSPIVRAHP